MRFLVFLLSVLMLCGCSGKQEVTAEPTVISENTSADTAAEETVPTLPPDPVRELLDEMSLEERVGQLFLARCDDTVALSHIQEYNLGGFVLFGRDFEGLTPDSFREKIDTYQTCAEIPLLLAVDEEGGSVARISSNRAFYDQTLPSSRDAYAWNGLLGCLTVEEAKCQLLQDLGLNVNLGPVCDISTQTNAFMYKRSLGQDVQITSQYVDGTVQLMHAYKIGSCLKHFPGYGNNTDTHTGIAVDSRSLESLKENDLIPFAAGIQAGCGAILVSHTIVKALDPELPASLSPEVIRYLREEMGFEGVIVTDDLVMQAITDLYGAGEAAVMAVLAGNDLLCSTEYMLQYEAVLAAVLDGRISIDVLNSAVRNVLEWKMELGLL